MFFFLIWSFYGGTVPLSPDNFFPHRSRDRLQGRHHLDLIYDPPEKKCLSFTISSFCDAKGSLNTFIYNVVYDDRPKRSLVFVSVGHTNEMKMKASILELVAEMKLFGSQRQQLMYNITEIMLLHCDFSDLNELTVFVFMVLFSVLKNAQVLQKKIEQHHNGV